MRRSLKSHIAFTTIILNINASKNVHTWNKRRTNFPRKFAKSKVVAVPALKQGTLVIMTKMSKRDGEGKKKLKILAPPSSQVPGSLARNRW